MKQLLLDTSIVIDFLRRKEKEKTSLYKLSEHKLSLSIVTHTELFAGKSVWEDKTKREAVEEVLCGFMILPLTEDISTQAGQIKAHLELSLFDSIIAATAIVHRLELVTFNIKDFQSIPDLKIFLEKSN